MKKVLLFLFLAPMITSAQMHTAGWSDSTFGINGAATVNNTTIDLLAIVTGDKLITVGNNANNAISTNQFTNNGSPDPLYGNNGNSHFFIPGYNVGYSKCILSQPDGKILIANTGSDTSQNPASATYNDFIILRLLPGGSLDTSFNQNGIVTTDINHLDNLISAIALQQDGKIIACGITYAGMSQKLDIIRYNPSGSIDTTFGQLGKTEVPIGSNGFGFGMLIQADGKIVLGGNENLGNLYTLMLRLNPDGLLDSTFGVNGLKTTLADYSGIYSMHLLPAGKILVTGESEIARYNIDGSRDSTFGNNGITRMNVQGGIEAICNVALSQDNKILAIVSSETSNQVFVEEIARYTTDGILDSSFGDNGMLLYSVNQIAYYENYINALQIQSDGKIIIGGNVQTSATGGYGFLVRYFPQENVGTSSVNSTEPGIYLYPNPVRHNLIVSSALKNKALFHIIDMNGKVVQSQELQFENGKAEVYIDLLPGFYMTQLVDENSGHIQATQFRVTR